MNSYSWLRYRFPALSDAELALEARLQEMERMEELGAPAPCAPEPERRMEAARPCAGRKMLFRGCDDWKPAFCEESAADKVDYAADYEEPEDFEETDVFEDERERMMREISERIERLRAMGVDELLLRKLFEKEDTLSRLVITRDFRILLPDYHDMEIEMTPLPKAVFLLFLRHEEGIAFKYLSDYEQELRDIYLHLTDRVQTEVIDRSIRSLCDPPQHAINEQCARIREAFVAKFDQRLAQHYFVTGGRGEPKRIRIQRNLVVWEQND